MMVSYLTAKKLGYSKVYFSFDCIGDTLILMSALEYLYKSTGKKILIGTRYKELIKNCDYLDVLDGFYEDNFNKKVYSKLISIGLEPVFISGTKFLTANGKIRPAWGEQHILVNVCGKLGIKEPVKVRTKMFLTDTERQYGRFFKTNQIAITGAGWQKYKTIPLDTLQRLVSRLKSKYNFVQIGHPDDPLLEGVLDMRFEGELRKTAAILYNSDVLVCGIGGMMHMARAVDCRSVVGFSYAEPLHLENYACNINVFATGEVCNLCGQNKSFPYLVKCDNNYLCIKNISDADFAMALEKQLDKKQQNLETDIVIPNLSPSVGIEDYIKRFGEIPD